MIWRCSCGIFVPIFKKIALTCVFSIQTFVNYLPPSLPVPILDGLNFWGTDLLHTHLPFRGACKPCFPRCLVWEAPWQKAEEVSFIFVFILRSDKKEKRNKMLFTDLTKTGLKPVVGAEAVTGAVRGLPPPPYRLSRAALWHFCTHSNAADTCA